MNWIIAVFLALPGFAALSMGMRKHQKAVFGAVLAASRSRTYKLIGAGMLVASTIWCMAAFSWALGLTIMCGVATLASVVVILLLTYSPATVRYLCWLPQSQ